MYNSFPCRYCGGEYTSRSGLTRHLRRCPVMEANVQVRLAAATAPVTHNTTVTNTTNVMIVQVTQRIVEAEVPLFDDFLAQMVTIVAAEAAAWRGGADTALAKIRELKAAVAVTNNSNYMQIGAWLSSRDIEREVDDDVDAEQVVQHTADQVNRVEETTLTLIKSYMPEAEQARLDVAFRNAGSLFAI